MDQSTNPCFSAILKIPGVNDLENEFLSLLESAGYVSSNHFVQKGHPRAAYFFGQGKIDEIGLFISEWCETQSRVDKLVFGNQLTPTQLVNIENKINSEYLINLKHEIEVMDKFKLVLEIFEHNAHDEEAKLQVELAAREYLLPFQKRRLVAKMGDTRKGEATAGNTYAGAGVSLFEVQEMDFKRSRTAIKRKLEALEQKRFYRREKYKKRTELVTLSLLGYTSAGKSSLLNAITKADAKVDSSLFTTLSTKTSGTKLDDLTILVSDTVGFIEDLPPFLFDAFKSTLEEATDTDMTFCVVDGSEDLETVLRKLEVTFSVLADLGSRENLGILLTKSDLFNNGSSEIESKLNAVKAEFSGIQVETISSLTGNVNGFWKLVSDFFPRYEYTLKIPLEQEKLKYSLYNQTNVVNEKFNAENNQLYLDITTRRPEWFEAWLNSIERKTGVQLLDE
ncbi:MAG: GTPase [Candidatus Odinarchaeota archaeon]